MASTSVRRLDFLLCMDHESWVDIDELLWDLLQFQTSEVPIAPNNWSCGVRIQTRPPQKAMFPDSTSHICWPWGLRNYHDHVLQFWENRVRLGLWFPISFNLVGLPFSSVRFWQVDTLGRLRLWNSSKLWWDLANILSTFRVLGVLLVELYIYAICGNMTSYNLLQTYLLAVGIQRWVTAKKWLSSTVLTHTCGSQ